MKYNNFIGFYQATPLVVAGVMVGPTYSRFS